MNSRNLLILSLVVLAVHQSLATFGACGCKEKGIDVCSCKKSLTIPRPYPITLPKINAPVFKAICKERSSAPQPFKPIGDECNCGRQIVKPAPQTKPPCPHQKQWQWPSVEKPTCNCHAKSERPERPAHDCGKVVPAPPSSHRNEDSETIYYETSRKKSPSRQNAPADVVSIAIAKKLANSARNGVSEKQLQYGSHKQPKVEEKSDNRPKSNINEENFYNTNGNVLEIHPRIFQAQESSESEESSEEEKAPPAFNPAALRFEQIGYQPYHPSKPRYVVVKNSNPVSHDCPNAQRRSKHHKHQSTKAPCNCYKDLVAQQSSISEQSVSADSSSSDSSNQSFAT